MTPTQTTEDGVFTDEACPDQDVFDQDCPEEVEELKDAQATKKGGASVLTTAQQLFGEADRQSKLLETKRAQDKQVALLIGAKNVERLRAFGFDIVRVTDGDALPALTTDGRSLERNA